MAKGLPRSHTSGPPILQKILKQTFVMKDLAIEIDGATGIGFGSGVLGDFPEGNILLLGAVAYVSLTTEEASGVVATFDGDYGVGTTPASDATITAADVNIIPSTTLAQAVAKVAPRTRGAESDGSLCGLIVDNTDGSLELNLNILIDDADISADDLAFTADGEVIVSYTILGDD